MLQKPYLMSKSFFVFLCMTLCISTTVMSQELVSWRDLADVKFEPKYNEKYGIDFLTPTFGDGVKALKGKKIKITGYFLDLTGNGSIFLVSQFPMSSCFHCGAAGPETVIEVNFKDKPPFRTDQIIEVTGTLDLNATDVSHCNYILSDVTGRLIN